MKVILNIFLLSAFMFISSCQGFVYKKHIKGDYYFLAVDSYDDMSISKPAGDGNFIGVLPACIYAYAEYNDYLIVKQHPVIDHVKVLRDSTNYYILNIGDYRPNQYGPYNKDVYERSLKELGIKTEDVDFKEL